MRDWYMPGHWSVSEDADHVLNREYKGDGKALSAPLTTSPLTAVTVTAMLPRRNSASLLFMAQRKFKGGVRKKEWYLYYWKDQELVS